MLLEIGGQKVLERTYLRCLAAEKIEKVWIATDSEEIAKLGKALGAPVIMTSNQHKSGTSRIAEAAQTIDAPSFINVQGDEPFIDPSLIDKLALSLQQPEVSYATAGFYSENPDLIDNPNRVKIVLDRDSNALYFSRSPIPHYFFSHDQSKKNKPYLIHLGIYGFKKAALLRYAAMEESKLEAAERLEQLKVLENGEKFRVIIHQPSIDLAIDTASDLKKAQSLVAQP